MNADAQALMSKSNPVTTVPLTQSRMLTYLFKIGSSRSLAIPFSVEVNGKISPEFRDAAGKLQAGRPLHLKVREADKVSLYLNSDALPGRRTEPAYSVTIDGADAQVDIVETNGRRPEVPPQIISTKQGGSTIHHSALLTGDIWARISHRFTPEEAVKLLPADAVAGAKLAIAQLYADFRDPTLDVDLGSRSRLRLYFNASAFDNVRANVSCASAQATSIQRTHPLGFYVLFQAALECGLGGMHIESCWRPLLGSIAHRSGLGIDITSIRAGDGREISLRRTNLLNGQGGGYVSELEQQLYRDYEAAKRLAQTDKTPQSEQKRKLALKLWDQERQKNEPELVVRFREFIAKSAYVTQTLDPWLLEKDTQGSKRIEPNEQISEIEKLHNNHFHLTIKGEIRA
jgi:hypothetical protein